jgi:hypothetical protein
MPLRSLGILLAAALTLFGCSSDGAAAAPGKGIPDASLEGSSPDSTNRQQEASMHDGGSNATVIGPITGGKFELPFNSMPAGFAAQYGYEEQEFFLAGAARAYATEGTASGDGKWTATPSTTAAYKTRLIVRRPTDPTKFNGTVFVEWLNVSLGADADLDFGEAHLEFLRGGYAYVGVSAQAVGIEGGAAAVSVPNVTPQGLKAWDPERYGSLTHPGDPYASDIFTQAAAAIRRPKDVDPLSGLKAKHVIASGDSQSAGGLFTYVNAVHSSVHAFDGFLIRSRPGYGRPPGGGSVVSPASIRTDLTEPVLQFVTETDLFNGGLNFFPSRQPDTDHIRTWEVAGTSHADQVIADYVKAQFDRFAPDAGVDIAMSCGRVNASQHAYVLHKAVAAITAWVAQGTLPTVGEPIQIADAGTIARDQHGNAMGGVRTPALDVPVATLSGEVNATPGFLCSLFGSTTPFDGTTLTSLYPTHSDYTGKVATAAQAAVDAGHLLPADQALIVQEAQSAPVPR